MSSTRKAIVGLLAAITVAIAVFAAVPAVASAVIGNPQPEITASAETNQEYIAELLIYQVDDYPAGAVDAIETPGAPTRYFLRRDYADYFSTEADAFALSYPEDEREQ